MAKRGGIVGVLCHHQPGSCQIVFMIVETYDGIKTRFGKKDESARETRYSGAASKSIVSFLGSDRGRLMIYWGNKE